jgi:hypothetical protein
MLNFVFPDFKLPISLPFNVMLQSASVSNENFPFCRRGKFFDEETLLSLLIGFWAKVINEVNEISNVNR